jgi:DNA-binding HxlR family transcriptional regulator
METQVRSKETCNKHIIPVKDALDVINGKWKLSIIVHLSFDGPKRFSQLAKELAGITDKVLSKELKYLEVNKVITRTEYDAFPPIVEYTITPHGKSLYNVIAELSQWGKTHRKLIMDK